MNNPFGNAWGQSTRTGGRVPRRVIRRRAALTGAVAALLASPAVRAVEPGYTNTNQPSQILTAYNIGTVQSTYTGAGQTIAIYTSSYYSTLQSDVDTFSDKYMNGSSTTISVTDTSGNNLTGLSSGSSASAELALDVEYAHLVAPGATIKVVYSSSKSAAAYYAANTLKASVVSISYGSWDSSVSTSDKNAGDANYKKVEALGHTSVLAAAGDSGSLDYPASSPYVMGVGATNLTVNSSGKRTAEVGWNASSGDSSSGGGGGVSTTEAMPSYQVNAGLSAIYGNYRVGPDVSIAGGGLSSLPVYVNGSKSYHYGSSIATPMWAGLIADVDQARAANGLQALSTVQLLTALYATLTNGKYSSLFYDVTSGVNSSGYAAGTGYDALTGLGTPKADALVAYLATVPAPEPTSLALLATAAVVTLGRRRTR